MAPSKKAMAPHSSTLAWKIPWTEEPGRLQSTGLLQVGHDWATSLSLYSFMHWRRKWQPTPVSCLENPRDGGAWWAAVYGVTQGWTRLKRLSSSSSRLVWRQKGEAIGGKSWGAILSSSGEETEDLGLCEVEVGGVPFHPRMDKKDAARDHTSVSPTYLLRWEGRLPRWC